MKIKHVLFHLENVAPLAFQEEYDNAGLLVGSAEEEVTGVLVTLDATEAVIDEAVAKGCNLVVAHHPILFRGIKRLTGKNYIERTLIKAIRHNVAIYASHTNLDNVVGGVNFKIAERLGLQQPQILLPKENTLLKLVVFVPVEHTGPLLDELYKAGAGRIGNYSECSFRVEGKGTFKANEQANPRIGQRSQLEEVAENRVEVLVPIHLKNAVLAAMRRGHIYEEVAYYLMPISNTNQEVGSGVVGMLPNPMPADEFLGFLKTAMNLEVIRHTQPVKDNVQRVALCGGSGGFLLPQAVAAKADLFITADYKYHEFFDADGRIMIADIGHYESEQFTKELLFDIISKKFTNFATHLSDVRTNPVFYYS